MQKRLKSCVDWRGSSRQKSDSLGTITFGEAAFASAASAEGFLQAAP